MRVGERNKGRGRERERGKESKRERGRERERERQRDTERHKEREISTLLLYFPNVHSSHVEVTSRNPAGAQEHVPSTDHSQAIDRNLDWEADKTSTGNLSK